MIVRGTTPYHTFVLPIDMGQIDELYVTYLQNGEVILDKHYGDDQSIEIGDIDELENASMGEQFADEMDLDHCQITVHLTQEETLQFHFYPAAEKNIAVVQLRVLTTDGEAYASEPIRERIFGVLKDGVIPERALGN